MKDTTSKPKHEPKSKPLPAMQQQQTLTAEQHAEWIRQQQLSCHNQD